MQEGTARNVSQTDFSLTGLSGAREWRQLLFTTFLFMFLLSVAANSMLMFVIISHRALHSPMCFLICAMSFVDLSAIISCVPNTLFSLLLNRNHITLLGCLVQMFCVHLACAFQSTILLWMALDRYFAICSPLHYSDRMAFSAFFKFVIIPSLRNIAFVLAVVSLAGSLSYCQANEIDHSFCEHMALVTLSCGSIYINNVLGLVATFFVPTVDFLLITASYIKIFTSVFKSGKSKQKALSTCITHIIVMVVSLTLVFTAFLSYRIKNNISSNNRAIISVIYVLFPGCFNPIVYGVRTKEIRQQLMVAMRCGKISPSR